jgi:hypothetical protein
MMDGGSAPAALKRELFADDARCRMQDNKVNGNDWLDSFLSI